MTTQNNEIVITESAMKKVLSSDENLRLKCLVESLHEKVLELNGVGFRANIKGENLNLQIGFSHDVNFKIPKDTKITVEKQTTIKINGVDKDLVAKIAADIKSLKPVEPYKAKGIKEKGQFVLRKEGKKK